MEQRRSPHQTVRHTQEQGRHALGERLEKGDEHRLALNEDGLHIPYIPGRLEKLYESSWDVSSLMAEAKRKRVNKRQSSERRANIQGSNTGARLERGEGERGADMARCLRRRECR